MATGPAPIVLLSLAFGESPLQGFVHLRPSAGTANWGYAVDVDGDGGSDHIGILTDTMDFAYRFTTPGIHSVRVSLTGPLGTQTLSLPAVVNNPSAIEVLTQREIANDLDAVFEGIAMNRAGTTLFVGDFSHSEIHRLHPDFLVPLGPPLALSPGFEGATLLPGGAEGLSVTPSDTLLLVAHKRFGLSVVAIPSMEIRRSLDMRGEFFIEALDETSALTPATSYSSLDLIDTRTAETIRSLPIPSPWHFAVSRSGDRVAVLDRQGQPPALHVASLPDLQELIRIPLLDLTSAHTVAFDPAGDRAYVTGTAPGPYGELHAAFALVDVIAGSVLRTMNLAIASCSGFCAANPVATLRNRRFVAMEQRDGTLFIDTFFDLPRYYATIGNSVAASPTEDAFYVLRPEGLVSKVTVSP